MDRRDIVRLGLLGGVIPLFTGLGHAQSRNAAVRIGVLIPVPDTGRFLASLKDGCAILAGPRGPTLAFRSAKRMARFQRFVVSAASWPRPPSMYW